MTRLDAAITETLRQLDDLISCGEEVVRETPQKKLREQRRQGLELFKKLRNELAEAHQEKTQ